MRQKICLLWCCYFRVQGESEYLLFWNFADKWFTSVCAEVFLWIIAVALDSPG